MKKIKREKWSTMVPHKDFVQSNQNRIGLGPAENPNENMTKIACHKRRAIQWALSLIANRYGIGIGIEIGT